MIAVRKGTHQGSKHIQLLFNNQDGILSESFYIPTFKKQYHIGIVSDGCTGLPGFSKTEVGASLLPIFTYSRCQQLICSGLSLSEIPRALFQACTEFLRTICQFVMPGEIFWSYPPEFKSYLSTNNTNRLEWSSEESKRRAKLCLNALREDHLRSVNPTPYKVAVSPKLFEETQRLLAETA